MSKTFRNSDARRSHQDRRARRAMAAKAAESFLAGHGEDWGNWSMHVSVERPAESQADYDQRFLKIDGREG